MTEAVVPATEPEKGEPGATPEKQDDGRIDLDALDPKVKAFVEKLLKDKQDANEEAKTLRHEGKALKAIAEALEIDPKELKADSLKTLKADSEKLQQLLKQLAPAEGEDPLKELAELRPLKERLKETDDAIQAMLDAELEGIDEDKRDLIPEGLPLQRLKWLRNARAKGLFGKPPEGTPPKVGAPPPSSETPTVVISDQMRKEAERFQMTPQAYAELMATKERVKRGEKPGNVQAVFSQKE